MKKIIIAALVLVTIVSCQDLTELNRDVKNPETVPPGTLFSNATVELFDFMVSPNVNYNNLRLWSQQWTQTTYTDESNYELIERDVNGYAWNLLYATVLRDLMEAKMFINEDELISDENKRNQLAIISVMEVFATHLLVDFFNYVPYNEALSDEVTPAYDPGADVYNAIIDKLNTAINDLDGSSGLGSYDLVYGGNVGAWKKFANSLKLRLAVRIAGSDNAKAQTMAQQALNSGVFESQADNFMLQYQSSTPYTNPIWDELVQSGRTDFVAAETIVNYMNDLEDPRRQQYFSGPMDSVGNPLGGDFGAGNDYSAFSHPGTKLEEPTFPGTIMDYEEVLFLMADAAERWGLAGGDPAVHYHEAITESILSWGGTQQEADDYLLNPDVAWATAPGDWMEKIGLQKWLAMYNRGFEAWSTYRVYNAPTMEEAAEAGTTPPLRYTYPVTEYSLNGESVNAAVDAQSGYGSFKPIFWDN